MGGQGLGGVNWLGVVYVETNVHRRLKWIVYVETNVESGTIA